MNESRGRHTGRLLKDQARAVEREFHPSGLPVNSGQVSSPWTSGTTLKDRSTTPWKTNIIHCAWIVLGILLLIGCLQILWAPSYLDNVVHGGITEALVFTEKSPNNENYRKWQSNDQGADSIPIKAYMQFWNLTNPFDVTNGDLPMEQRLPQFQLSPPIVFTQYYYRENITFSEDGSMVRSYFKTVFHYDST